MNSPSHPVAPTSIQAKAPASRDFHQKEWEVLRADIRAQIEQSKNLEFATIVALGAFYAWYLSVAKPVPKLVLMLPVLAVALGGIRSWATLKHIQRMGAYIRTLEESLSAGSAGLIGWDRTRVALDAKSPELKASAVLFWIVTSVVTVLAWWYLP